MDTATAPLTAKPLTQHGAFQAAKEGWLKVVASYPNLSGADYAVVIVISTHLNSKSHNAWPSIETLAKFTNRNKSTISRSVRRLEALRLIGVVHSRGRHRSNRYSPLLGDLDPKSLIRRTTPRGKILRVRNEKAANSQQKGCGLAARTSEEEQKNL